MPKLALNKGYEKASNALGSSLLHSIKTGNLHDAVSQSYYNNKCENTARNTTADKVLDVKVTLTSRILLHDSGCSTY